MLKPFKSSKVQGFKVLGLVFVLTLELLNPLNLEPASRARRISIKAKPFRVIVGSTPGGGYDLWARLMAQHIGKHIPGHPTVIVQNMPGAGGVIAANFVYSLAKPDGLTMGAFNPAALLRPARRPPGSQIRLEQIYLDRLAGEQMTSSISFAPTRRFKSIDDLRNAKDPPKCGSTGPGTTAHYFPRLLEDTLGIKTTIVTGYQGGSEIDLAIERNEVHLLVAADRGTYFGREPYKRWHKSGFIRVVFQTGAKRDRTVEGRADANGTDAAV